MFSGIVETTVKVCAAQARNDILQLTLERPPYFDDLKLGDSVAVDGVCLTLEKFDGQTMQFALAAETLRVTGWSSESVLSRVVNVERSLRLSDRIHGHLVSGHVDSLARVIECHNQGEGLALSIEIPKSIAHYIWQKGSVAINGVSLTVNSLNSGAFQVGLIPETRKRTSLGLLKAGDMVNLEADNWARGLLHWAEHKAGQ